VPVIPTSYEALCLQAIVSAVIASPTYIAIGGTASTTVAMFGDSKGGALIASDGAAINTATLPIWCHVNAEPSDTIPTEAGAPKLYLRTSDMVLRFFLRATPSDLPIDAAYRVLNAAGGIRQDIEDLASSGNLPLRMGLTSRVEEMTAPGSVSGQYLIFTLTANIGDIL